MSRLQSIESLFQEDTERVENSTYRLGDLYIDFSKTHLNHLLVQKCVAKANANNFDKWKRGLFSGEKMNFTEELSVLHTLTRQADDCDIELCSDVLSQAAAQPRSHFQIL